MIKHAITHYYQPSNHTCGQSSIAMLLSFFGKTFTPEEITEIIPVNKNDKGEDWGTITQQIATWCISQGFDVEMHTADFQIIDLSWMKLSKDEQLNRMELAKDHREVPSLGKEWSKIYMQSYIDFLNSGGELHIQPRMSVELIEKLLPNSPIMLCVCYNVLYGCGRSKDTGLRESEPDDIEGKITNHFVVIVGKSETDNYLIADPWRQPGVHEIESERLIIAMTAAQIECDNILFQLKEKG